MTAAQPERATVTSWAAMRAWRLAIHSADLKPRTALLGLLIADHVNPARDWHAWPAQATLARLSGDGDDRRHVRNRIGELVESGWIDAPNVGRRGKSARYRLVLPVGAEIAPTQDGTESAPTAQQVGADTAPRVGAESAPRVGADSAPNLAPNQRPDVPRSPQGLAREHLSTCTDKSSAGPTAAAAASPASDTGRPVHPDVARRLALIDMMRGEASA